MQYQEMYFSWCSESRMTCSMPLFSFLLLLIWFTQFINKLLLLFWVCLYLTKIDQCSDKSDKITHSNICSKFGMLRYQTFWLSVKRWRNCIFKLFLTHICHKSLKYYANLSWAWELKKNHIHFQRRENWFGFRRKRWMITSEVKQSQ